MSEVARLMRLAGSYRQTSRRLQEQVTIPGTPAHIQRGQKWNSCPNRERRDSDINLSLTVDFYPSLVYTRQ